MRYLLIAFDFPPVPSPQSLRWAYLVRELARMGHELHVLAPDSVGYGAGGLPELPDSVVVHRFRPGPISAFLSPRRRAPRSGTAPAASGEKRSPAPAFAATPSGGLNWKGRVAERLKRFLSWFMFPDLRAESLPEARRQLEHILASVAPDLVITSHEPACTIEMGLQAKRQGFRWLADLGDPVLAPYTPRRWRRHAWALESRMCSEADAITVASEGARTLLQARHRIAPGKCHVVTQGYDQDFSAAQCAAGDPFDPEKVELLYTGSFYSFRRAASLLDAVAAVPGVRLNIASMAVPDDVLEAAKRHPSSVRLLGFLAHRHSLALQRCCDVLVNIANDDPVQVPGKLYEYLGATAPILNIERGGEGAVTTLLSRTGAGISVADDPVAIRSSCSISSPGNMRRGGSPEKKERPS